MELYFSPLACSLATRIALYEAGAPATFTAVDLRARKTADGADFLAINPMGQVPVLRTETLDGVKFYLDNPEAKTKPNAAETWLLLRASGTEPLMRIYSESGSKESVAKLLGSARAFALQQ